MDPNMAGCQYHPKAGATAADIRSPNLQTSILNGYISLSLSLSLALTQKLCTNIRLTYYTCIVYVCVCVCLRYWPAWQDLGYTGQHHNNGHVLKPASVASAELTRALPILREKTEEELLRMVVGHTDLLWFDGAVKPWLTSEDSASEQLTYLLELSSSSSSRDGSTCDPSDSEAASAAFKDSSAPHALLVKYWWAQSKKLKLNFPSSCKRLYKDEE